MIGTPRHQARGYDDGVAHFVLDPMVGGMSGVTNRTAAPRAIPPFGHLLSNAVAWPWKVDAFSGRLATPEWPRGILRSANKVSELNILNSVPRIVIALNTPYVQKGPMTAAILSRQMPVAASSIQITTG